MNGETLSKAVSDLSIVWHFEDIEVDEGSRELRVEGEIVEIEPRPMDLLLLMLRHAGEVITNEEIIANAWPGRLINDASFTNVTNAISKLRKLLRDERRQIIATVHKVGYRFSAKVQRQTRTRRRLVPALEENTAVPGRPQWLLTRRLDSGSYGDAWIATHVKTAEQRVFKFCSDSERLSALKREATLFRILRETLGDQAPVPALLEWQFDSPPFYTESELWGMSLDAWSKQNDLSGFPLSDRLRVVELIANAIASIHSVGVLHKDIKPQNILISESEGTPQVRLCDFGTGGLLDLTGLDALGITRQGFTKTLANAGTPAYLAPELQRGGTSSVQSDIYSIGVLLYQMVIGEWRALTYGWEAEVDDELLRDDIALAVDPDPRKRLPSALLLAQRLQSLPERRTARDRDRQEAQRVRETARTLELARARRPWVIGVGTILLIAVAVSASFLVRARQAAKTAATNARIAQDNEQTARGVAEFLSTDLVRQASPDYGGHVDVSLKSAVLNSIPNIGKHVASSDFVVAALDQSLAEALSSLSDPGDAATLDHQASQLDARLYGPNDRRTLVALLDELNDRLLIGPVGPVEQELHSFDGALQANISQSDAIRLEATVVRARIASMKGDDATALSILKTALASTPVQLNADVTRWQDEARLAYLRSLVLTTHYDTARSEGLTLLPQFQSTYGNQSRFVLKLRDFLGRAYAAQRGTQHDYAAAEAQFRQALEGSVALYGADSAEADFASMDLGDLLVQSRRWSDAEDLERRLLASFSNRFGPNSTWTWRARLLVLVSIAFHVSTAPSYQTSSADMGRETLEVARSALSKTDYMYPRALLYCAKALIEGHRFEDVPSVIAELTELLGTDSKLSREERNYVHSTLDYIRGLYAEETHDSSALGILQNAVTEMSESAGPDSPEVEDANRRLKALEDKRL